MLVDHRTLVNRACRRAVRIKSHRPGQLMLLSADDFPDEALLSAERRGRKNVCPISISHFSRFLLCFQLFIVLELSKKQPS